MYPKSFDPKESVAIADGNYIFPYLFQFDTPISEIVTYTKAKAELDSEGVRHYKTNTITKLHVDLYPDVSKACEAPTTGFPRFGLRVANLSYEFAHNQTPKSSETVNEAEVKREKEVDKKDKSPKKGPRKRFKMYNIENISDLSETRVDLQWPCEITYSNTLAAKSKIKEDIRFRFTATEADFFKEAKEIKNLVSVVTERLRSDDRYKDYTLDRIWTDNKRRRVQITVEPLAFKKQRKLEENFMKTHKLGKYGDNKRPTKKKPKKVNTPVSQTKEKLPASPLVSNLCIASVLCCV